MAGGVYSGESTKLGVGGALAYDAGLVSLEAADAGAGLCYPSGADTWTRRTFVAGDIFIATSTSAIGVVTLGAANTIPVSNGTTFAWSPPSATLPGARVADELYGSGRDGAVVANGVDPIVIDGVTIAPAGAIYTLTGRDINATTLALSDAVVLAMGGGLLRCRTLVGPASGTAYIRDNGANASGATAGASPGTGGSTGRNAGAGATGRGTSGVGAAAGNITGSIGSAGGAGGAAAGGSPAGGAAGTATRTAAYGTPYAGVGLTMLIPPPPVGAGYYGGGGGGAGGNDAGNGVSGGGGAGGGIIGVFAQTLSTNADRIIVQANGGDGGHATGTDNGGGGGGGGGHAALTYDYGTLVPTVQANGGAAGNASGSGANGTVGPNGVTSIRKMTA